MTHYTNSAVYHADACGATCDAPRPDYEVVGQRACVGSRTMWEVIGYRQSRAGALRLARSEKATKLWSCIAVEWRGAVITEDYAS